MKKRIQKIMLTFVLSITMITSVNISPIISNSKTTVTVEAAIIPKYTEKIYVVQNKTDLSFQKHNLRTKNPMKNMGILIGMEGVQQPLPTLAGI